MPIPVGKGEATSPRKLFSYPAFAAISQGTRTRKYREIFEPRIEAQVEKPRRNPLYNENLIIIEIGEYPNGVSRATREARNTPSQAIREDELPKRDTVRQVRLLFESAASSPPDVKLTKSHAQGTAKYNRSSLEKILLCSTSHPKLIVSAGMGKGTTLESGRNSKSFIYAMPDSSTMRWPSFKEHGSRPASLRSGSSRQSTDTESFVSESSDLSTRASDFGPGEDSTRHNLFDKQVEGRFVSPQIMEKLRSCGRSFRFINGRMIDDKGNEIERAKLDPLEIKIYARSYKDSLSSSGASSADEDSRSSSPYFPPFRNSRSKMMIAGTCVEQHIYGTCPVGFDFP